MVSEVLSVQYDTTYEPATATFAPGVVCVVRLVVSPADAKAATGLSVAVPSYASRVNVALTVAVKSTAWLRPASAATATLL